MMISSVLLMTNVRQRGQREISRQSPPYTSSHRPTLGYTIHDVFRHTNNIHFLYIQSQTNSRIYDIHNLYRHTNTFLYTQSPTNSGIHDTCILHKNIHLLQIHTNLPYSVIHNIYFNTFPHHQPF